MVTESNNNLTIEKILPTINDFISFPPKCIKKTPFNNLSRFL